MSACVQPIQRGDDALHPGTCELLRGVLDEEGLAVSGTATSGEAAVEMVRGLPPDVVLMDLRMPGMGGVEATRRIKELNPSIQVVILTVYDEEDLERSAEQAGAFCYLVKGCPPSLIRLR